MTGCLSAPLTVPNSSYALVLEMTLPQVKALPTIGLNEATAALPTAGRDITGFGVSPDTKIFRLSTVDFATSPADSLRPNIQYTGRLDKVGTAIRNFPLIPDAATNLSFRQNGVTLTNADGAFDGLTQDFQIVGSLAFLYLVDMNPMADSGDWVLLARQRVKAVDIGLSTAEIQFDGEGELVKRSIPLPLYAGTGDEEGPAALADTHKPRLYGHVLNLTPIRISTLNAIYQFHDGAAVSVDEVRVGGEAVTQDSPADYADFATLQISPVMAGTYATCLAEGLIRLGTEPSKAVTMAATGQFGVHPGDIAAELALEIAGDVEIAVNESSFRDLDAGGFSDDTGYYMTESVTYAALIGQFLACIAAVYGEERDGTLVAARLDSPPVVRPVEAILYGEDEIFDISELALPEPLTEDVKEWRVHYGHNDTIQTDFSINAVDPGQWTREWKERARLVPNSLSRAATPEPLDTLWLYATGAEALLTWLTDTHVVGRRTLSIEVPFQGVIPMVPGVVEIKHSRLQVGSGRLMMVVGVEEDLQNDKLRLTLWG